MRKGSKIDRIPITNLDNEVWRDVVDYEGKYMVSNYGRIKSLPNCSCNIERLLVPQIVKRYPAVGLVGPDRKQKNRHIHRLVALAFLPNPDNLPQVNHKDEDKFNNYVHVGEDGLVDMSKSNLEWCTAKYNLNYGTCTERRVASFKKTYNLRPWSYESKYKPIEMYDLDGNFIRRFDSIKQAGETMGICPQLISCTLRQSNRTQSHGYRWKYAGE